jgi:zinc protease
LESDRMRSLKVTQENLDNQRQAVQEEKRLRYDNQPYINAFLLINELIFKNPANAHSTIGSMEDLDAATIDDIRGFFRVYYAPNNAVLTVVGDFDSKQARHLIETYFEGIPRQPDPPPVNVSEPPEVGKSQEAYHDKLAPAPAFILGWKIPPRRTPDHYALALAGDLLFAGESSRLYQQLVKGDESVVSIQGEVDDRRGPSALYVFALPKPGEDIPTIREQIFNEIKRLATAGPSDEEMEKLRNTLSNDAVRGRQSTLYRAQRIAEYAPYDGDPTLFDHELDYYLKVTADQIKAVTANYLDVDNRVVLDVVPAMLAEASAATTAGSAQSNGESPQPAAPAPQIPAGPKTEPPSASQIQTPLGDSGAPETERPLSEPPAPVEPGSGPVHP